MKLEKINYSKIVSKLFPEFELDWDFVDNKKVNYKFTMTNITRNYDISPINDVRVIKDSMEQNSAFRHDAENIQELIMMDIIEKYVTKSPLALDLVVYGKETYYTSWSFDFDFLDIERRPNYLISNHDYKSEIMDGGEKYKLSKDEVKELIFCANNLMENFGIDGQKISFLKDKYSGINVLQLLAFKDEPERYKKYYTQNQLENISIKNYNYIKTRYSDSFKELESFWTTILSNDRMMKDINNPLLRQKDEELELYQYKLKGSAYYGDNYETYKHYFDKYFISNEPLEEGKLIKEFKNSEIDLLDLLDHNFERIANNDIDIRNRHDTKFVKIIEEGKHKGEYIFEDKNKRFNYIDKKLNIEINKNQKTLNHNDKKQFNIDKSNLDDLKNNIKEQVKVFLSNGGDVNELDDIIDELVDDMKKEKEELPDIETNLNSLNM